MYSKVGGRRTKAFCPARAFASNCNHVASRLTRHDSFVNESSLHSATTYYRFYISDTC